MILLNFVTNFVTKMIQYQPAGTPAGFTFIWKMYFRLSSLHALRRLIRKQLQNKFSPHLCDSSVINHPAAVKDFLFNLLIS